jgi:RND family efflux transporter MFP subunit
MQATVRPELWVVVLSLVVVGCGGTAAGRPDGQGTPVKMETLHAVPVEDATEYVATLKSRDSAVIMPQVEGQVTQILVHSGERVAAGTPLMQIDQAKQQATLKTQEETRASKVASLEYAKQQFERVNRLYADGIMSKADLDSARSALDSAKADAQSLDATVREQQVQLHYYSVSSPTDGIVGDIPVRVGDRVTVSTMLTTVDQAGSLEAYVSVPIERAPQLHPGLGVEIVDSDGNVQAQSKVSFVSPEVDNQTQTVLVKAAIAGAKAALRTAQFIRARIVWGTRQAILVPVLVVSRISGQHFAFVAEDSKGSLVARQRPLRVGEMRGNDYVVLDGVKDGERLIVSGTQFLQDGAPVTAQP